MNTFADITLHLDPTMDREVVMEILQLDAYKEALQACLKGKSTKELRLLYLMPCRERVPWELFPNWARPTDPVEGGHEGGCI